MIIRLEGYYAWLEFLIYQMNEMQGKYNQKIGGDIALFKFESANCGVRVYFL